MSTRAWTRTILAWLLFAATLGCLAAGLLVALALMRPLTLAARLDAAISEPLWAPAIALGITLPLLLPPDGRPYSRRWRVGVWASAVGATCRWPASWS